MPVVHTSTIKRARQAEKRNLRNQAILHTTKSIVKKVRTAIQENNAELATSLLPEATSALHKAVTKGVMPRNTASRRISRLTTAVNSTSSSK